MQTAAMGARGTTGVGDDEYEMHPDNRSAAVIGNMAGLEFIR
jgi:hypothetical protein